MGQLFSYTLYSGLLLAILYLTYKWMLAGEKQHACNRRILLGIYAVSAITPALAGLIPDMTAAPAAVRGDIDISLMQLATAHNDADAGLSPWRIILWVYISGLAASVIASVVTAVRLTLIIASGQKRSFGKYTLVLLNRTDIAPFSWRRYIVMSQSDYDSAGEMISAHECEHLRLHHWLDMLVAQAAAVIMWYNPASWLMREELKTVHEFQADERVLRNGINAREYQMLLIKKAVGARFPSLANSLNHSKLKKRITMMYNSKTSAGRRRMRALSLAPALAAALIGANVPFVTNAMKAFSETELSISANGSGNKGTQNPADVKVLDDVVVVGYGQADDGAVAVSGKIQDKPAAYPGGDPELFRYLTFAIRYPADAIKDNIQGRVAVKFDILEDGRIANLSVVKSVSPSLDAEALRVIGDMPRWTPAYENGKATKTSYVIPVEFRLTGGNDKKENTPDPAILVDGKAVSKEYMEALDKNSIESIDIKKDDPAYPGGIIKITMKK